MCKNQQQKSDIYNKTSNSEVYPQTNIAPENGWLEY